MVNFENKPFYSCCFCDFTEFNMGYPYETFYNGVIYKYLQCKKCNTVNVYPKPDKFTLSCMYDKPTYHDLHYSQDESRQYSDSAELIRKFLPDEAFVLDYGCGKGQFLKAIKNIGLMGCGVEYDKTIASNASKYSGFDVFTVDEFYDKADSFQFDALHLGDVLEHFSNPREELQKLLNILKPGAIIFIEGPLESNINPVFLVSRSVGFIKKLFKFKIATFAPYHLIRADSISQKMFLKNIIGHENFLYWNVYDTGWPYINGKNFRHYIGLFSLMCSGFKIFKWTLGNRFQAIINK